MSYPHLAALAGLKRIETAADRAARAIPPLWPLASSVAVNPFLGQTGETLVMAGARLARVAGAAVTMPRRWYEERICAGTISDEDLFAAWTRAPAHLRPANLAALKAAATSDSPKPVALPTIASFAAEVSGVNWPGLIGERFGAWAEGYFDKGQALWAAPHGKSAYAAWQAVATHDLTPEIAGLPGFARHVSEAPDSAIAAIARVTDRLNHGESAIESYFHQMLMTLGGWAQYARYQLWQAELTGGSDEVVTDLLAIRLIWEEALFLRYGAQISKKWASVRAAHAVPIAATTDLVIDAGFFGLGISHRRFASDVEELRLSVLLNPGLRSCSGTLDTLATDQSERITARARRAWGRFKLAAVSSFAFVEATGPFYMGKLLSDTFGLHGRLAPNDPPPRLDPVLDLETNTTIAETVLRAMSLTKRFAPLVLLAGHGANVVNNPHASGLHCGACGGYSGEVNARILAAILNDPAVRTALRPKGIEIPEDTFFLAALHDTTTDQVTLYAQDYPADTHQKDIRQAKAWLAAAGKLARGERALRLPRAKNEGALARRGRDWAETRPEWGLAGCKAFIAAPRTRTAGKNFEGRAFLHDYDWKQDESFRVLELILTAPVVVASWISLQYYGSTVAPDVFGSGNKLLHNVTGGIGVVEGNGGLLRAGLPWQSVHDGKSYSHEPLRLSVCIEAPRQAISDVLSHHAEVRALFDNGWLTLFALDDAGRIAWRYAGDLQWIQMSDVKFSQFSKPSEISAELHERFRR